MSPLCQRYIKVCHFIITTYALRHVKPLKEAFSYSSGCDDGVCVPRRRRGEGVGLPSAYNSTCLCCLQVLSQHRHCNFLLYEGGRIGNYAAVVARTRVFMDIAIFCFKKGEGLETMQLLWQGQVFQEPDSSIFILKEWVIYVNTSMVH